MLERVSYTRSSQEGVQGVYSTPTNWSEGTSTVKNSPKKEVLRRNPLNKNFKDHSAQFIPPEQLTTKSNIDPATIKCLKNF